MKKGSNWRQCKNSFYKIYPSSCSDELINLCWYCWGGGFSPSRLFSSLSLSEILTVGFRQWAILFIRTWSDLLLHQYLFAIKTNQFSIHYLHQQKRNLLSFSVLTFTFFHTNQLGKSLFVIIRVVYHNICLQKDCMFVIVSHLYPNCS